MVSDRRRGTESSATRVALIEAAEQLIREEGYPAVTARNLADKLDLKRQIVHYYFHTMDDVFIAVIRKNSERLRARLQELTDAEEPLRALQVLNRDSDRAILAMELNALANRRPSVRAEVARAMEEARDLQTRLLTRHLVHHGITPGMPPIVATILLTSLAQVLAMEAAIDVNSGHAETLSFVDACLRAFAAGRDVPFPTGLAYTQPSREGKDAYNKKIGVQFEKLRTHVKSVPGSAEIDAAIEETWDGTVEGARALAHVIRAVAALRNARPLKQVRKSTPTTAR